MSPRKRYSCGDYLKGKKVKGMPYKSKEERRKYAREWARERAKFRPKIKPVSFALSQIPDFKDVKTYEKCVEKAAAMVANKKLSQLIIGRLALRACHIKWGGRVDPSVEAPTLTQFAKEIGVSNKTLTDWVKAVRLIEKLPQNTEYRYADCHFAIRESAKSGVDASEIYSELISETTNLKRVLLVERFSGSLIYTLKKIQPHEIENRELAAIKNLMAQIQVFFKGTKGK